MNNFLSQKLDQKYVNQALSASYTTTSSWAITSSFALNGVGSGTSLTTGSTYPITSSWAVSASWAPSSGGGTTLITASTYQITSSWSNNSISSSFVITSSWANVSLSSTSASFASSSKTSISSSWASSSISSSYSTTSSYSVTSSFATSASWAPGNGGGTTLTTASTYQITSSWSISSSWSPSAGSSATASFLNSTGPATAEFFITTGSFNNIITASTAMSFSYILQNSDNGKRLECVSPSQSRVIFSASLMNQGWTTTIIQSGDGMITIIPASGTTIWGFNGATSSLGKYTAMSLVQSSISASTWYLVGSVT